jgi:hypothetical protein
MSASPQLDLREVVDVQINGTTYRIRKLGAKVGKNLLGRLIRAAGPVFQGVGTELESGDVISKLCAALKEDELNALCDAFAKETRFSPDDNPDLEFDMVQKFDTHFSGRYGQMTLWLKAGLEANYGNFFDELGLSPEAAKGLLAAALLPSVPSTPSTKDGHTSGASSPVSAASAKSSGSGL